VNVVTVEAEWALERLIARLAEFRALARADGVAPLHQGRHTASRLRTHDVNALVDIVAIAESFSVSRLVRVREIPANDLMTWAKREKAWRKETEVDLAAFSHWTAFMGFVETRNAIQHGLGKLTERQLGEHKQQVLGWLDAAGVHRNGDFLLVSADDAARCAQTCRDFIGWLDLTAPAD
jgi:hypothetical protein